MTLNERFDIYISYKTKEEKPERFRLSAKAFFDSNVPDEYDPDEWDCYLPWREEPVTEGVS